jgi:hypothetical protein
MQVTRNPDSGEAREMVFADQSAAEEFSAWAQWHFSEALDGGEFAFYNPFSGRGSESGAGKWVVVQNGPDESTNPGEGPYTRSQLDFLWGETLTP